MSDWLKLADWLHHMQNLNKTLAHVPEMAQHIANLSGWETSVRALAAQQDGGRRYSRQDAVMIAGIIQDEIGGEVCTPEWSQAAADRIVCALENNEGAGPEQGRAP